MEHLDFDISIGAGSEGHHPVEVLGSPAGETTGVLRFPFDALALENRLQSVQIAMLSAGRRRRDVAADTERPVREFGEALFDALFDDEVGALYQVSLAEAHRQGKGLRIRVRFAEAGLAGLPWEFLYDQHRAEYVCLSTDTPLVRYLELAQVIEPLRVTPPLRILGMVVSPSDLSPLDVDDERQRIDAAVSSLQAQGRIDLHWLEGGTWRELQRALRTGDWHVFHFIGHGGFDRVAGEGVVALADDRGRAHQLSATELGRLLGDHHPLRLAVLNSCEGARADDLTVFSSTAAIAVRRGTPAVVAMQYEITDVAAIELSRVFYEALVDGYPVDMALAEARKAVSLAIPGTLEWGTPVLYMRSPDGVLFDVGPPAAAARPDDRGAVAAPAPTVPGPVAAPGAGARAAGASSPLPPPPPPVAPPAGGSPARPAGAPAPRPARKTGVIVAAAALVVVLVALLVARALSGPGPGEGTDTAAADSSSDTAGPDDGTIGVGDRVEGEIGPGTDAVEYPFTGSAGEVVYLAAVRDCADPGLYWEVLRPDGSANGAAVPICTDLGRANLGVSGEYRVRVYAASGANGAFAFELLESRPDNETVLTGDEEPEISGHIDYRGAADVYRFESERGLVAYLRADDGCNAGGIYWQVERPDGSVYGAAMPICTDIGRVEFGVSGTYTIRVYSDAGAQGEYRFEALESRPDNDYTIAVGEQVAGDIDLLGAIDRWEFESSAGEAVVLDAARNCDAGGLYWELEQPDGSIYLATVPICSDIGRVELAESGTYAVVVKSLDRGRGEYEFSLRPG